jgi:hypothetical protein
LVLLGEVLLVSLVLLLLGELLLLLLMVRWWELGRTRGHEVAHHLLHLLHEHMHLFILLVARGEIIGLHSFDGVCVARVSAVASYRAG